MSHDHTAFGPVASSSGFLRAGCVPCRRRSCTSSARAGSDTSLRRWRRRFRRRGAWRTPSPVPHRHDQDRATLAAPPCVRLRSTPGAGLQGPVRAVPVAGFDGAGDTNPPGSRRPPRTPVAPQPTAPTRSPPRRSSRLARLVAPVGGELLQQRREFSLHLNDPPGLVELTLEPLVATQLGVLPLTTDRPVGGRPARRALQRTTIRLLTPLVMTTSTNPPVAATHPWRPCRASRTRQGCWPCTSPSTGAGQSPLRDLGIRIGGVIHGARLGARVTEWWIVVVIRGNSLPRPLSSMIWQLDVPHWRLNTEGLAVR